MKNKILCIHCETTGINFSPDVNVEDNYEIVSLGMVVCDDNFSIVDDKILYIQPFGIFSEDFKINSTYHGITKEYLINRGITKEQAILEISNFILKHFDPGENIVTMGHNIATFSLPFLKSLLKEFELYFKFSSNTLDTFSVLYPTVGAISINEMLNIFGTNIKEKINEHLALKKCQLFVNVFKRINELWKKKVIK